MVCFLHTLPPTYPFTQPSPPPTVQRPTPLQVSSYDLINPGGRYSSRVRLLGSFHPQLAAQSHIPDGQDIDDALYGNEGGMEEQVTGAGNLGWGGGCKHVFLCWV